MSRSGLAAFLLFIAGTPWPRFVMPGIAGGVPVSAYIMTNEHAWRRVLGFLDPSRERQGSGWQLVQSYVAFGHGGLFGQGLGNGRQKLEYLPEVHTDFVPTAHSDIGLRSRRPCCRSQPRESHRNWY